MKRFLAVTFTVLALVTSSAPVAHASTTASSDEPCDPGPAGEQARCLVECVGENVSWILLYGRLRGPCAEW